MSTSGNLRTRKAFVSVRRRTSKDDSTIRNKPTDNKQPHVTFSTYSDSSVSMPIIPPVDANKTAKFKSTSNIVTGNDLDRIILNALKTSSSNDRYVRTVYTMGKPSPLVEESFPEKDNTSKLANLWEDKISGSDEKGVRKTSTVDIPDEIIVQARSQEKTGPINVNLGVAKIKSTASTHTNPNGVSSLSMAMLKTSASKPVSPASSSHSVNMREKVEVFERLASSSTNRSDRVTSVATSPHAATQLGVGLRPINSDISRRPSESSAGPFNRRLSSIPDSVDNSVDELHRKIERMQLRIAHLERQYAILEKKCAERSS